MLHFKFCRGATYLEMRKMYPKDALYTQNSLTVACQKKQVVQEYTWLETRGGVMCSYAIKQAHVSCIFAVCPILASTNHLCRVLGFFLLVYAILRVFAFFDITQERTSQLLSRILWHIHLRCRSVHYNLMTIIKLCMRCFMIMIKL